MLLVLCFGIVAVIALLLGVEGPVPPYDPDLFWFFWVLYLVCAAVLGWGDTFMPLAVGVR